MTEYGYECNVTINPHYCTKCKKSFTNNNSKLNICFDCSMILCDRCLRIHLIYKKINEKIDDEKDEYVNEYTQK